MTKLGAPVTPDPFALDGKVAIVTGAARGIGLGVARALLEAGANVLLVDISSEGLEIAAAGLPAAAVAVMAGDVATAATTKQMVAVALQRWGRLDVLVCNAGITRPAMLSKMTEDQWDEVLRVNLKSVFLAIQAAAEPMKAQVSGSIICISSMGALRGTIGQANYAAAKAGMIGLARAAAKELAQYHVRVNAIAPGTVETPMTETILTDERLRDRFLGEILLGRVGQPSDIGNAVRFLAGDGANWITGQVLSVNGGAYI